MQVLGCLFVSNVPMCTSRRVMPRSLRTFYYNIRFWIISCHVLHCVVFLVTFFSAMYMCTACYSTKANCGISLIWTFGEAHMICVASGLFHTETVYVIHIGMYHWMSNLLEAKKRLYHKTQLKKKPTIAYNNFFLLFFDRPIVTAVTKQRKIVFSLLV